MAASAYAGEVRKSIHSPQNLVLRSLLVRLRKKSGLTQVQLAGQLGVLQSMISEVERGERILDFLEMVQYLEALKVDFLGFYHEFERESRLLTKTQDNTPNQEVP